jgi:transposase
MPGNRPGPARKDDRMILSGIVHLLTSGCRWRDCPAEYGPRTATRYDRLARNEAPAIARTIVIAFRC